MEVLTGEVIDVIDIHNEFKTYEEFKGSLDEDFWQAEERFVIIGYKLKAARDTDILRESGYKNVNEFARAEYGLDRSQVSRFMRINDRFSVNGYSKRLDERYRGFGHSKLAVMLTLPEEINEELSSSYSRAEIQAIREEVDEERRTTDLEVMLEEKDERQQDHSALGRVLYQIGKDNPELYLGVYDAVCNTAYDGTIRPVVEKLMDVLAPAGEAAISVKVAGERRKMLIIKGADIEPVLVEVRSGGKQSYIWNQMIDEMETMCPDAEDAWKAWEILYGEPFPEKKAEVAPVQPKKEQSSRKVSKVTKAQKPEKTLTESVIKPLASTSQQNEEKPVEETEDRDGQEAAGSENKESKTQGETCADSGQAGEPADDPEPADKEDGAISGAGEDSAGGGADGEGGAGEPDAGADVGQGEDKATEAAGGTEAPEKPEMTRTEPETAAAAGVDFTNKEGFTQHVEKQKEKIREKLLRMESLCGSGDWNELIEEAGYIITITESIRNMEEVFNG